MTESSDVVAGLVTRLLGGIDELIAGGAAVSDGDILQALSMTLAVRARMIEPTHGSAHQLVKDLVATSLQAHGVRSDDVTGRTLDA